MGRRQAGGSAWTSGRHGRVQHPTIRLPMGQGLEHKEQACKCCMEGPFHPTYLVTEAC